MTTATKKLNGKTGGPTADDLAKQIEILQSDISSLTQTMADMGKAKGSAAVNATKEKMTDARDKAAEHAEAARLQAAELQGQANDFIKNQPATAMGIAAGFGFLVGYLSSRR